MPRLVLASQSPARLGLLRAAGIEPEVQVSGVSEDGFDPGRPAVMAAGLARRKALAVADQQADALVLGCDSVLELDGTAHGKPVDAADATRRWRRMRGRAGILHTGHCLIDTATSGALSDAATSGASSDAGASGAPRAEGTCSTVVRFADVSDEEIDAYVATGEPLHVAGAFTLDGRSAPFVERVDGDPSNVIGLSLPLLRRLLAQLGHRVVDLWS